MKLDDFIPIPNSINSNSQFTVKFSDNNFRFLNIFTLKQVIRFGGTFKVFFLNASFFPF